MEWLLPEKGLWALEKLVVFIPTFPLPPCQYMFSIAEQRLGSSDRLTVLLRGVSTCLSVILIKGQ